MDLIRLVLLAVVTAALWCVIYDRWTAFDWQTPVTYLADPEKGDVIMDYAWIKAASEGHVLPFAFNSVPELGAPYTGNWNDYPLTEKPLLVLTGGLARIVGVFAAANIALLLAQVLAAISFYIAARLLDAGWIWSFAGALVFAFSRYVFAQGMQHLTVTYCWHVPLCLVVVYWMMRENGIEFGTRSFGFALLIAFITGVQNIYYTNMFVQLIAFGGLLQGWRRGWKAALPAIGIAGTAIIAFSLMNLNTFIYSLIHGGNEGAVVRNYQDLEVYGLKLVDLVMPPPDHRFPLFAAWGTEHLKEILLSPGEMPPSAYLGVLGLAAMTWLVIDSGSRALNQKKLPLEAWLILWIVLYAEVGGLNSIAGTFGLELFRATTRYSIFILGIVLLYVVQKLSTATREKTVWAYGMAIFFSIVALWDQTPPMVSAGDLKEMARAVTSDREFTAKMEDRLPSKAMVFQVPVIDFPESRRPGIGPYDNFRPYLYSHQLRFSFGSDKGRPQEKWQHDLAELSLTEAVTRLESYGFSALYVNLNSFTDKGVGLIRELKDMDRGDIIINDRGDLLCVFLKPLATPIMPDRS